MAEDKDSLGDINRVALDQGIASQQYTERRLGTNYASLLRTLDSRLFTDAEGLFKAGWRTVDVGVGAYLAPKAEQVPHLLNNLGVKVGELEPKILRINYRERIKLAAWVMLIILKIHPRVDGNGRLAEAAAEQLLPSRKILGTYYNSWDNMNKFSVAEMMRNVSLANGQPIPDLLIRLNEHFGSHDQDQLVRTNLEFYRWGGKDWVAKVLAEEIKDTSIDEKGYLISPDMAKNKALMMLAVFLDEAPERKLELKKVGLMKSLIQLLPGFRH